MTDLLIRATQYFPAKPQSDDLISELSFYFLNYVI